MPESFATPDGFIVSSHSVSLQSEFSAAVWELFAQYEIVHQSQGRIRIRMPRLAGDQAFGDRLVQALGAIAGVTQVNLNRLAKSVTVYYEENSDAASLVQRLRSQLAHTVPVQVVPTGEKSEVPFKLDLDKFLFKFDLKNSPLKYAIDQVSPEYKPFFYRFLLTLLQVVGSVFLVIGIVGVILPLLPGTPFLILSALCFSAARELSALDE